jgi:rubrerythrin
MRYVLHVLQAVTLSVMIAAPLAAAKTKTPPVSVGTTLDNLQTAFAGETNAHARYLAFSEKAQAEGFGEMASLFRALAASEQIHANNHAAVIRTLGGTPREVAENAAVQSTRENLRVVIDAERWERSYMYPAYITKAAAEGNEDAVRSFTLASISEAGHAVLCTQALNNLDNMKASSKTFQVCSVCGFVEESARPSCRACASPREKFVQVS